MRYRGRHKTPARRAPRHVLSCTNPINRRRMSETVKCALTTCSASPCAPRFPAGALSCFSASRETRGRSPPLHQRFLESVSAGLRVSRLDSENGEASNGRPPLLEMRGLSKTVVYVADGTVGPAEMACGGPHKTSRDPLYPCTHSKRRGARKPLQVGPFNLFSPYSIAGLWNSTDGPHAVPVNRMGRPVCGRSHA